MMIVILIHRVIILTVKRKYLRLAPSTWAAVRAEWEIGDTSLEELSARYGVNSRTLQAHFAKNHTAKGAKAAELAVAIKEELFSEGLAGADDLVLRAKSTRETSFRNAVTVENLIMAQLHLAQQDPSQAYKAAAAVKLLSLAAAGLERLHNLKWNALGLNSDAAAADELPVLIFRDLTTQEIDALHKPDDEPDEADGEVCGYSEPQDQTIDEDDESDGVIFTGGTTDVDGFKYVQEAQPKSRRPRPRIGA